MQAWNPLPRWLVRASRRRFLVGLGALGLAAQQAARSKAQVAADPPMPDLEKIQQLLAGDAPLTWVFTGDSITHGALHTLGTRSYPEHFAERVRWELRRMRDVVINTGISGNRTGDVLADLDWRVLRFEPHVVSIMLGMNDCTAGEAGHVTFRDNLTELVTRCREAGAALLLHTPNTIYVANAGGRSDVGAYAQLVREVAAAQNTALVDHYAHWEQAKPDQEQLLPWLEDQSIHPGVYGHREFAKETFRALGIFDPASPTCALEVP